MSQYKEELENCEPAVLISRIFFQFRLRSCSSVAPVPVDPLRPCFASFSLPSSMSLQNPLVMVVLLVLVVMVVLVVQVMFS